MLDMELKAKLHPLKNCPCCGNFKEGLVFVCESCWQKMEEINKGILICSLGGTIIGDTLKIYSRSLKIKQLIKEV